MFIRVKNIIINSDQITSIHVYKNSKDFATSSLKNYITVHFSGDDKERIDFESDEKLEEFLSGLQIK